MMISVSLWWKHIYFSISTLIPFVAFHKSDSAEGQSEDWILILLIAKLSLNLKVMTSRIVNQSSQRHYMLTTLSITRRPPPRYLAKHLPSNSCIRSFTLSHSNRFEHNHSRAQSKPSKAFPEAMDAIKQTIAQNLGVGVCAFPAS